MLTSPQNPLVKQIRKLHRARDRREQNLFLLEGTNLIEAVCDLNYPLITLCATPKWVENHSHLWEKASLLAAKTLLVTPEILTSLSTTVNPDGVIATAIPKTAAIPSEVSLGVIAERVQDPGNLGTIIRTAVATNADVLWLSEDSVDLDNPKLLRSSVGEWFRLPMVVVPSLTHLCHNYQAQGFQIIATLPSGKKTYWEVDYTRPTIIMLGNEGSGLSQDLISLADEVVTIPMGGKVESLNVAIAAALLLYEVQRQRKCDEKKDKNNVNEIP